MHFSRRALPYLASLFEKRDVLQEIPLNKTAPIPTTDTPQKPRKLQQEDLGDGARVRKERGGRRFTRTSVSVLLRPVRDPSGAQDGKWKPPRYKSGEAGAHNQGALVLHLLLSLPGHRSRACPGFPRVEERGKERNIEPFSSNSHPTRQGSTPHVAIRTGGLWQEQVLPGLPPFRRTPRWHLRWAKGKGSHWHRTDIPAAPTRSPILTIHCTMHNPLHVTRNRKVLEGRKSQRTGESWLSISDGRASERAAQALQPLPSCQGNSVFANALHSMQIFSVKK